MGRIRLGRARWGRMGERSESNERIPALELSTGYLRTIFPILLQPWLGACTPVTHSSRRGAVSSINPNLVPTSRAGGQLRCPG